MPRIAVFTKNRTNPAYDAARLGADRTAGRLGATTVHYVPDTAGQRAGADRADRRRRFPSGLTPRCSCRWTRPR